MAKSEILGIQGKIKIQDKENEDLELLEILERILIRKRGYVIKIPPRGSNVVACMSGGLDSTINLAILMEEFGLKVYPFFINRGQSAYIYEIYMKKHLLTGITNFSKKDTLIYIMML